MLANLRALFGVMVDIVLLRRGPESLPASPALLFAVVAMSVIASSFIVFVTPVTLAIALLQGLLGAAVMLLWFRMALVLAKKQERFLQTMTAVFGVNVLFVPVMIPLVGAMLPYLEKSDPANPPPAALLIITMMFGFWALWIEMRIVRLAFECPWIGAFLLVIGEFFAAGFVSMLLFGGAPNGA
jgi:hypothetical protein